MTDTLLVFLLQLALILIVTRAGSFVAIKLRVAPVLGELAAGIILGPTVFGLLWPAGQGWLFPPAGAPNAIILDAFAWTGLILLMFVGGLEIEMNAVRSNLGRAICIMVGAIGLSFAAGFIFAGFLPAALFPSPDRLAFRLFFANALAITAVPVLIES